MIACGLCSIWQPSFVKNYSACCSRHSVYVFFNRFISRIENKFKPPRSDRGFLFEGFFQKFLHHTAIYSFSNWFVCFDFRYFFYNKDFFAFCKVFSTSHIAQGIIKLIAWTTSSGGTPGFWDHVINMKCKQSNDVSTLVQKYSPVCI